MGDTGGKSGRRPGRHLQVEASGPGNAASVQQRLAGRFGGKFEAEGGCAGPGGKVDAPELSSGPVCEIQEVSRLGAQGVTAKSKLLAREMPRVCSGGLRADSGEDCRRKGGCAGPGGKVDTPELSSGPVWEIQEVTRVGAQGVTSKSKLLAREMPRVCSRGLRVFRGKL